MKKVIILVKVLLLSTVVIFSCNQNNAEDCYFIDNFDSEKYEENKNLWELNGLKNYEFTYRIQENTSPNYRALPPMYFEITTVVKDGKGTISFTKNSDIVSDNVEEGEDCPEVYFFSMDDAFKYISHMHELYKDEETFKKISFDSLRYNETYHYPEYFYLDTCYREKFPADLIVDCYYDPEFTILDFKILD